MTGRLEGKTAVITAAGQGMGRATVLAFLREGARIWATDIDAAKLETLRDHAGVTVRRLDVLKVEEIKDFSAEIDAPDILFNCAGFVHNGSILDCDEDALDRKSVV